MSVFDEATGADIKKMRDAVSRVAALHGMDTEAFFISPPADDSDQCLVTVSFSLRLEALESPEQAEGRKVDEEFAALMGGQDFDAELKGEDAETTEFENKKQSTKDLLKGFLDGDD